MTFTKFEMNQKLHVYNSRCPKRFLSVTQKDFTIVDAQI